MEEKIVMMFHHNGAVIDIETPVNITANKFIYGMNSGFGLGIDMYNHDKCLMRAENPVALI